MGGLMTGHLSASLRAVGGIPSGRRRTRSTSLTMGADVGGGLQEPTLLFQALIAAAEATPEATSLLVDLVRTFLVPDLDFLAKLMPLLTYSFALVTVVGKVRSAFPRPPRSPFSFVPLLADYLCCCGDRVADGPADGDSLILLLACRCSIISSIRTWRPRCSLASSRPS